LNLNFSFLIIIFSNIQKTILINKLMFSIKMILGGFRIEPTII